MMLRTHVVFTLFLYILALKIFSLNFSIFLMGVLVLGSVFPDFDVFIVFSKHRGFFHSFFGALFFFSVFCAGIYFFKFSIVYAVFFVLGYLLHLALDSITISGINWFWKSGHVHGPIKTAGIFERLFFFIILMFTIWLLLSFFGKTITAMISKIKP